MASAVTPGHVHLLQSKWPTLGRWTRHAGIGFNGTITCPGCAGAFIEVVFAITDPESTMLQQPSKKEMRL